MSAYRTDAVKYPYLTTQFLDGKQFLFMMTNERSESWYGDAVEANRQYLDLISPGDTVIDCGANEGFTSILAALKVGPAGKVFAIEAAPHNIEPIKINAALNGLQGRLAVVGKAVSDRVGILPFLGEIATGDSSSAVESITLDETFSAPDVIKIDVEGFEAKVLRGAKRLLELHKPTIFLEPHLDQPVDMRNFGDTPEELYKFMSDLGYIVYQDGAPIDHIPHGAVVLWHPHRQKARTLIYTVAIGPFYRRMAELWRESLIKAGYTGKIVIYSDAAGPGVVELPRSVFKDVPRVELLIRHYIGAVNDFSQFDYVMHMDCDCLAIRPINELFKAMETAPNGRWCFTEMELTEDNRKYFLPPGVEPRISRGIGGAIFASGRASFSRYCKQIVDEAMRISAWEMPCFDQNALNGLAARGEIDVHEWPREWACFSNIGSEPITEKTKIVHFTGDPEKKLCYMNSIFNLCK